MGVVLPLYHQTTVDHDLDEDYRQTPNIEHPLLFRTVRGEGWLSALVKDQPGDLSVEIGPNFDLS